jgi:hypothetical protein
MAPTEQPIAVEGEVIVDLNHAPTMLGKLGYSRDWRFTRDWKNVGSDISRFEFYSVSKMHQGKDEVEIGAIAPRGVPLAMSLSQFAQGGANPAFSEIHSPLPSILYYDGSYANDLQTGTLTTDPMPTDWHITIYRWLKVGLGGLVNPQVSVRMECEMMDSSGNWQPGYLSWVIPGCAVALNSFSGGTPFLNLMSQSLWSDESTGFDYKGQTVLQTDYQPHIARDEHQWTFQYCTTQVGVPGHFFFTLGVAEARYHYYDPAVRLPAAYKPIHITVGGATTRITFGPLNYALTTTPRITQAPMPSKLPDHDLGGSVFNQVATVSAMFTNPVGVTTGISEWDVTPAIVNTDNGYLPTLTVQPKPGFGGTSGPQVYVRPVIWYMTEDHPATLEITVPSTETTLGIGKLQKIELTETANYRGGNATVSFFRDDAAAISGEPFWQNWQVNDRVTVKGGWQPTMDQPGVSQTLCQYYIRPGGLPVHVGNDTVGSPVLQMQVADFATVQMFKSVIVDFRQAANRTIGEWFRDCGLRMGVPSSEIDVAADVEALEIPGTVQNETDPTLQGSDGDTWQQHIDQVAHAMGLRWGCNKTVGKTLFIDGGPAVYVPGTSTIALHVTKTATGTDRIYGIDVKSFTDEFSNAIKLIVGKGNDPRLTQTYHRFDTPEQMAGDVGRLWWTVIHAEATEDAARLVANWLRCNYNEAAQIINVRMIARPDLVRESFVMVDDDFGNGVKPGSVFRIVERKLTLDATTNSGELEFLAVVVYVPS